MKNPLTKLVVCILLLMEMTVAPSCSKSPGVDPPGTDTTIVGPPPVFDINSISDTYGAIAPFANYLKWGSHNVHDPSIKKFGNYYYCYSTDVAYGTEVRPGIQVRRSKDLIQWEFFSWVFNGLPAKGAQFISQSGGIAFQSLWAPYVMKHGTEYRLYYSLSSAKPRLSVIGLATSTSPEGPWTERGLVVTSKDDNSIQTNAIDPTVVVTPGGDHYMYYGSAWDGIYVLKLNANNGLAAVDGDKGKRIAQRGFTGDKINGNIEGPEVIYNSQLNKYFMFIAYDWLESKYNVRVGRADAPTGPFYDYNNRNLNEPEDNLPMILAPYKFDGHAGYQGVSHVAVFENNGEYYLAHQARPVVDRFFMNLHVRNIYWTADGWPVVSPERYAGVEQTSIGNSEIAGQWERIVFNYNVVPGYADEQKSPDLQVAETITIDANGTINGNSANTWTYSSPWLQLNWNNNASVEKVHVQRGRDWENKKNTLLFTGLNDKGIAVWGKRK